MATIKLQPSGNVLIKDGKVSCGCCVLCSNFDLDFFFDELPRTEGAGLVVVGDFTFDDKGTLLQQGETYKGGFKRRKACLRWLCREVVVSNGVITSERNTEFGGPTTNGKDLWVDIVRPLWGDETLSGTYVYEIEFYGWRESGPTPNDWISEDDEYYVTKNLVTKN